MVGENDDEIYSHEFEQEKFSFVFFILLFFCGFLARIMPHASFKIQNNI